jgi:hypothetical protein
MISPFSASRLKSLPLFECQYRCPETIVHMSLEFGPIVRLMSAAEQQTPATVAGRRLGRDSLLWVTPWWAGEGKAG